MLLHYTDIYWFNEDQKDNHLIVGQVNETLWSFSWHTH